MVFHSGIRVSDWLYTDGNKPIVLWKGPLGKSSPSAGGPTGKRLKKKCGYGKIKHLR
jgi:hypothetical protein